MLDVLDGPPNATQSAGPAIPPNAAVPPTPGAPPAAAAAAAAAAGGAGDFDGVGLLVRLVTLNPSLLNFILAARAQVGATQALEGKPQPGTNASAAASAPQPDALTLTKLLRSNPILFTFLCLAATETSWALDSHNLPFEMFC